MKKIQDIARRLPNGLAMTDRIISAGQIRSSDLAQLAEAGYRTIVDLRAAHEPRGFDEAREVKAAGLQYVNIPVVGPPDEDTYETFRGVLREAENDGTVVHCASGNRVGGLMIPYLVLDKGMSEANALQIAMDAGLRTAALAEAAHAYIEHKRNSKDDTETIF